MRKPGGERTGDTLPLFTAAALPERRAGGVLSQRRVHVSKVIVDPYGNGGHDRVNA